MKRAIVTAVVVACSIAVLGAAKIKVRAEPDPSFDFAKITTWAWDADAGDVMMARTEHDDPAELKARIDPLIRKYVEAAMIRRGLTAAAANPDVHLHYYVLVTIGDSSHTMGQFLPAVPYWGLPPFNTSTTALTVVTKGSLVLDALLPGSAGERRVIWRGIAQSTVEDRDSDAVRDARLREASDGLIQRFPRKKK